MSAPVALVTGAGRGIGAATVDALVAQGWAVVATDACADDPALPYALATRDDLANVAARGGDQVRDVVADVRDHDALCGAVRAATETFGRLDAAVAVAGVVAGGVDTWELDATTWQTLFDVNVTGVWNLARAAVPALHDAQATSPVGHAGFVAIASAAGRRGLPRLGGYAAAKHAVIGLIRSMAIELGPTGVTANAICPGSTRTAILQASAALYDLDDRAELAAHHAIPRLVEPTEIAATVAHVCGPAGAAITGAVLDVDAGLGVR